MRHRLDGYPSGRHGFATTTDQRGLGDGSFGSEVTSTLGNGQTQGILQADFDGDGNMDDRPAGRGHAEHHSFADAALGVLLPRGGETSLGAGPERRAYAHAIAA